MNSTATLPQVLRSNEAAKYLKVSERTLWTLTKSGKLPAAKVGNLVRYRIQDLDRYLETCLTTTKG